MKDLSLHLDRCIECPYSRNTGRNREECHHPEIGGKVIEKPNEPGCIPLWCPLADILPPATELIAMVEARALSDGELLTAMVSQILESVILSNGANPQAIAFLREAERRIEKVSVVGGK